MFLNMPENASINCIDYAKVLSMPHHLDIWQSFEYASGIKCARVLNMTRYSYNNIIIIVINVTILEFLSDRFVSPGFPQLTISSFF